jgi:hypothetical protein
MDLDVFTDFITDITAAVGTVGAAVVGVLAAAITFGFVMAWIKKARRAGSQG